MNKPPSQEKMAQARYQGEPTPNYEDPLAAEPNLGKASFARDERAPNYIMQARGYTEYR